MNGALPANDRGEARAADRPVIFFDGVCGLCNRFVNFVLARDKKHVFRFAPLQGETARAMLPAPDVEDISTVVVLSKDGSRRRSSAVVSILRQLGGVWAVLGMLLWIVPSPLRDLGYKLVARSRYRLFGKKEVCRMPTPEERAMFLP